MKIYRILVASFWLHCFVSGLYAQKSLINTLPDLDYKTAVELFEKQKYVAAQQYFQKVIDKPSTAHTGIRANAEYYSALCALELTNPDAEYLLVKFLAANPENYKVNEANFYMARHQYNEKKYSKAVEWFDKVDASKLSESGQAEYHFEAGYSYFMVQKYDKARLHFAAIKDVDTKYTAPALYYYSHIAYEQKNYETALEGFLRLRDDETFAPIVPYYITQIYFLQKKYDKVIAFAPSLLDSVTDKRVGDMSRMIGESYSKQGKYSEALPYFEKFAKKSPNMTIEDRYQVAYAYYKAGDLKNAVKYFEPVTTRNNAMAQNALYHLADCYLKMQDKQKARLAFSSAANMNFNDDIKENALFNYAVVTYELSLSTFNEPVKAFNEYLKLYPYSNHADEARNYLVLAYMSTKNYQAALDALDKIKKKDNSIRRAYQRISFFRGLELYNSLKFENAIDMFDKSLGYAEFDKVLASRAYYWKGESLYRMGKYQKAIELYQKFISAPGAASLDEFELAHYNVAYAYFNQKKYDEALTWFRKYTGLMKNEKSRYVADSYNRMGDCYFMKSSYWVAIENYDKAISYSFADVDYAMFQKAFALGLVSRTEKKVALLNELINTYPKSSYIDDALYELGRGYVVLNSNGQAIESYNKLLKNYPSSSYAPKALLNLGLIYYNTDKNDEAIANYKRVVEQYPGSPDSRNALNGLKTVYMENNDVDSYFAYLEKKGEKSNVRSSEQDSLTYTTAENVYMSGDCDKAQQQFQKYIDKYKDGSFLVNANFYLADCQLKNNKTEQALKGFEYVVSKSHSMFSEQALSAAATIHYNKEEYAPARDLYKRLETEAEIKNNVLDAKIGQMRCNYRLKDAKNAIVSAKALLTEKIQDEVEREARYILAKSYLETQNTTAAVDELKVVSKDVKSVEGAEAKYLISQLYYDQGKKDLAEKEIFDFINKNTPYQYWLGKSFILLSDIYVDRKDEFQAVHTLQSILDYYENPDDGIKAEAKARKDKLTAKAGSASKEKQSEIEVNLDNKKKK
ncbi:MAG: tetratricopeptide repeat protein [Bacteroidota bacterium]|nr:tetratricopeptide repeat protein [Bacteroidota bacterium]